MAERDRPLPTRQKKADSRSAARLKAIRKLDLWMEHADVQNIRGKIVLEISYCDGVALSVITNVAENEAV